MEEYIETISCDDICRLCISQPQSINIFTDAGPNTPKYSEIILLLINVLIDEKDELPKGICSDCGLKLLEFYKFKEQIEKSINELEDLLKSENCELQLVEEKDEFKYLSLKSNEIDQLKVDPMEELLTLDHDEINITYGEYDEKNEDESNNNNSVQHIDADYNHNDSNEIDELIFENYENIQVQEVVHSESEYIEHYKPFEEIKQDDEFNKPIDVEQDNDNESVDVETAWRHKLDKWIKKQKVVTKTNIRYKCELCGKDYGSKFALNNHNYVHTGELNFECTECGRKFGQKKLLQAHMEVKHIKSKFFYCDTCGKCFNRKNNLLKHQWVHLDTGRFRCDYCGRIFKWKTSLNVHLTSHTGLKEYNCYVCGKNYTSDASRRKHCKQMHDGKGTKPVEVEVQCDETITEQGEQ